MVMAIAIVAALLGLLGTGPLNSATLGKGEAPLSIREYERFIHFMAPTSLRVRLNPVAADGKEARLWFSEEYLEGVQVQKVTPQPKSVEAGSGRLIYVFEINESGQPTDVTFNLQPEKIGPLKGRIGYNGRESLGFAQFVYP